MLSSCVPQVNLGPGQYNATELKIAATLAPKDVKENRIHAAKSYWLAANDKLVVTQVTEFSFILEGQGHHWTCTFSISDCVEPDGSHGVGLINARFGVEVLECPGLNVCSDPAQENVLATLTFDVRNFPPLADVFAGQEATIAAEDAVYQIRPIFTGPGTGPFRGDPATPAVPVTFVPQSMGGREFLRKLTPSGNRWNLTVGFAGDTPWDVNFSPRVHVTGVQVLQGYPKATQGADSLVPEDENKLVPIVPGGIDVGSSPLAPTCWADPTVLNTNMQHDGDIDMRRCRLHQSNLDAATGKCVNPPGAQTLTDVTPAYVNEAGMALNPLTWSVRFDSGCPALIKQPVLAMKAASGGGTISEALWIRFFVEFAP